MIAYLDNSATTRPGEPVIAEMAACMRGGYFNPSSLYAPAMIAEKAQNRCREQIERALCAPAGRVTFTSGGTEANNLAVLGSAAAMHGARHFVLSAVEHPSVLATADALCAMGHRVSVLRVLHDGQPDFDAFEALLRDDPPDFVSCMQVNNETGAMPELKRLSELLRRANPAALLHVDGVQGFLREPFDARLCDLYSLSAHKLHGPKGVGALWVRQNVRLLPRQIGGGQELSLRSGTENTPGIAGLSAAIAHMPQDAGAQTRALKARLVSGLSEAVPGLVINGPTPDAGAGHILNASFPGVRGEVMLHALEAEGVYVSTGSACSSKKRKLSPVLLAMGVAPDTAECALRFSLSPFTEPSEIDYAVLKAGALYAQLSRFKRR